MFPKNLIYKLLTPITSRGNRRTRTPISKNDLFPIELARIKTAIRKKSLRRKINSVLAALTLTITCIYLIQHMLIPTTDHHTHLLRFDNAPLSTVISALEQEFHIQIITLTNTTNCQFTGSFYSDTPQQALRLLSESMNLKYTTINNQRFQLNGSGCN